jgi:hypothetical protein
MTYKASLTNPSNSLSLYAFNRNWKKTYHVNLSKIFDYKSNKSEHLLKVSINMSRMVGPQIKT